MTRVLHLISSTDRRGAQVFATQLVESLGGAPQHRLMAIAQGAHAPGVAAAALGPSRWHLPGAARLVGQLDGTDVLVAHGSSALLHGAAAAAVTRTPFIYRNIGDPAAWGAVRGASIRIGAPLRMAAAVAALYPGARTHLVATYRLDPQRVVTIPNGVPDIISPDAQQRSAARAELAMSGPSKWVGFVGALSEEKRILTAIEAVAAAPELGLVVAGGGPQADAARALAARLAPGRARFLGIVEHPRTVLAAVDVVLMPSRTEGIPAVAIEAGLSSRPAVATSVGGLPEVIVDGVTGVLVDDVAPGRLATALRVALAHAEDYGDAARRRCVERFTMQRVGAQWNDLIEAVAQRRAAASSR